MAYMSLMKNLDEKAKKKDLDKKQPTLTAALIKRGGKGREQREYLKEVNFYRKSMCKKLT